MTPKQFRDWRRAMDLKQKDAGEYLGLKKRVIQYYEKGERNGKPVEIPKYIALACFALSRRVVDYDGKHIVLRDVIPLNQQNNTDVDPDSSEPEDDATTGPNDVD